MKKPNGIVIYDGPSKIDGKPILCIVTGFRDKTDNAKTGRVLQSWIIRKDMTPVDALKTGQDYSLCGTCKHRHFRTCYVTVHMAPQSVYAAYNRGSYQYLSAENKQLFEGKIIRIGSYGEPTAIPFEVWDDIIKLTNGHTSYSHRWKKCDSRFKDICMASVDTLAELNAAQARGWRTFRVRLENETIMPYEFVCPASNEAGRKTNCANCKNCSGGSLEQKSKCPTIVVHGSPTKMVCYKKRIKIFKAKRAYARNFPALSKIV